MISFRQFDAYAFQFPDSMAYANSYTASGAKIKPYDFIVT